MPYIKQKDREKWIKVISEIEKIIAELDENSLEGELNFFITSLLKKTYEPRYFNYNRAIGLLECIKQEFYRKDVAPYEDKKINENGDVK